MRACHFDRSGVRHERSVVEKSFSSFDTTARCLDCALASQDSARAALGMTTVRWRVAVVGHASPQSPAPSLRRSWSPRFSRQALTHILPSQKEFPGAGGTRSARGLHSMVGLFVSKYQFPAGYNKGSKIGCWRLFKLVTERRAISQQ